MVDDFAFAHSRMIHSNIKIIHYTIWLSLVGFGKWYLLGFKISNLNSNTQINIYSLVSESAHLLCPFNHFYFLLSYLNEPLCFNDLEYYMIETSTHATYHQSQNLFLYVLKIRGKKDTRWATRYFTGATTRSYNRKRDVNNGILVNSLSSSEWITGFKMLEVAVRKEIGATKGGPPNMGPDIRERAPRVKLSRKGICHDLPLCSCCLHVFCSCQLVCR